MKIKKYSITRYGPLTNIGPITLHDFNLFFGENEDGKTLTIDAMVKMLLGRNIKDFERIDRVDEYPEGHIIIEKNHKEIKLPEKGNLTRISDLTPSECRNIFVVRDSDLHIRDESEFYVNMTDHLTGLRTEDIFKIREALMEMGKITRSGSFSNTKFEKLKTRIEDAENLIENIKNLLEKLREEKLDILEEEYAKIKRAIEKIEQEVSSFEDARKRETYENGKEALNKLKHALERIADLEVFNKEDEQLWRDSENIIEIRKIEKEGLLKELDDANKKLEDIREILKEREQNLKVLEDRKKILDDEIKPEIINYKKKDEEVAHQEAKGNFLTFMAVISVILFGISLLGIIISPSLFFYILAVLFFGSMVISGAFIFRLVSGKAWLAKALKKITLSASKLGLGAEDITGILSNIQTFEEKYSREHDDIESLKNNKEILENKSNELKEERIPKIKREIESADGNISDLRKKTRVNSIQEYSKELESKMTYEKMAGEQESALEVIFRKKGRSKENISYWADEVGNLEEYKAKAKGIKYNEKTYSNLKTSKKSYRDRLDEIDKKMRDFKTKFKRMEIKINEILRSEADRDYFHCETSVDLEAAMSRLKLFIGENENNKNYALEVMKIFEMIEAEEKEKVSKLFGRNSPVSKYFNKITDGLYKEVTFNRREGKIEVKRKNGEILEAEKLSGGARDQLYLSIRLALGKKLLKDKKGFFILDDPFVKADPIRLQKQMEILKIISGLGWQILYFTAKGEVKDALRKDIVARSVNYVEIQGIPL